MTVAPGALDGSLDGVVAAETAIAHVDGQRGIAIVRGYPLPDLASRCSYEDVAHLVLCGELPLDAASRSNFEQSLRGASASLSSDDDRLARLLAAGRDHADALCAAMVLADDAAARALTDPIARMQRVLARVPSVCAAVSDVVVPPGDEPYARRCMAALGGKRFDAPAVRALEVALILESEHGLSASTFACRIAASSGANAGVSLSAAVATLSGPRHGGATAEALRLLEAAAASGDVGAFVRERFARKARLPGFGHRIYKVADPRVPPLRTAIRAMGRARLLPIAEALECEAAPLYGAKGVHANIDLYGAALFEALGVDPAKFVAAFTLGITCGWLAHWNEQRTTGRLVRPESQYTGPAQRPLP